MLLCLSLICWSGLNQGLAQSSESFPQAYLGRWEGILSIHNPQGGIDTVDMRLDIGPDSCASQACWTWRLRYGTGGKDDRPYQLVQLDKNKGIYQIDEKNGIILDAVLRNNVLMSRFSVGKSLLLITYHLQGDEILFEVFTGGMETSNAVADSSSAYKIENWPVGAYQVARLTRNP